MADQTATASLAIVDHSEAAAHTIASGPIPWAGEKLVHDCLWRYRPHASHFTTLRSLERHVELTEPRKALDQAGADTRVVSPKDARVRGGARPHAIVLRAPRKIAPAADLCESRS